MLRFINNQCRQDKEYVGISIHLMLRFIHEWRAVCKTQKTISIHLMLRFIEILEDKDGLQIGFQYISCYGLSTQIDLSGNIFLNFNTSHVTVYPPLRMAYQSPRPDFNTSHVTVYPRKIGTYILKNFISIHLMLRFIYLTHHDF